MYQEEKESKMEHTLDEMMDIFGDEVINYLITNISRKYFCKQ